jgi:hypothetical protein
MDNIGCNTTIHSLKNIGLDVNILEDSTRNKIFIVILIAFFGICIGDTYLPDSYDDLFSKPRYSITLPKRTYIATSYKIKQGVLYFKTYPDKKEIVAKDFFVVQQYHASKR